jgi:hypothetical protein
MATLGNPSSSPHDASDEFDALAVDVAPDEEPSDGEERGPDGARTGLESENEPDGAFAITTPFKPEDVRVRRQTFTVTNVLELLDAEEIDLQPDFQRRGGIWNAERMSRLIESMILRLPLPYFYFARMETGNVLAGDKYIVVDGLQRLTTIRKFHRDELALRSLQFLQELNGKTFSGLPAPLQRRLSGTNLEAHVIEPGVPKDVVRTIFHRINTGGVPLSAQEIRHALYGGRSAALLRDLAGSAVFLKATRGSVKADRMLDRECVLRVLAFLHRPHSEYLSEDMDKFLSDTMEQVNKLPETAVGQLQERFEVGMQRAHTTLRGFAFRKYDSGNLEGRLKPVNKALMETQCVVLAGLSATEFDDLATLHRDRFQFAYGQLLTTGRLPDGTMPSPPGGGNYLDVVSTNTSQVARVQFRFAHLERLVRGFVDNTWRSEDAQ